MILRWLITVAALSLLLFALVELMRRTSLFHPVRYPAGDWNATDLAPEPEDLWFVTEDGVRLHGWLFAVADPDAPLLVYYHGNGGNLTHRVFTASGFAERGVSVFLFDYRGYGRSEGSPSERGLYRDAEAAWDLMRRRHSGPLIPYGESLGGAYAAWVAREGNPCAIVLDSTFPSMRAVARSIYHPVPLHWLLRPGLETARSVNASGTPALVMHSVRDEVLPIELGRQLHDAIAHEKEWYESPRAAHAALSWSDGNVYYDAVTSFIARRCGRDA